MYYVKRFPCWINPYVQATNFLKTKRKRCHRAQITIKLQHSICTVKKLSGKLSMIVSTLKVMAL